VRPESSQLSLAGYTGRLLGEMQTRWLLQRSVAQGPSGGTSGGSLRQVEHPEAIHHLKGP
jgi:hypothetical protein